MNINDPIPSGALLADLRDREDYEAGHMPGAKHMSVDELLLEDPDTPMILYCYRGIRSIQAAMILRARGFHHVVSVGGINKYRGELVK